MDLLVLFYEYLQGKRSELWYSYLLLESSTEIVVFLGYALVEACINKTSFCLEWHWYETALDKETLDEFLRLF